VSAGSLELAVHHRFRVRAERDGVCIDAAAELRAPWTVLFGASGIGKSTLLRGLCGLLGTAATVEFLRFEKDRVINVSAQPIDERDLGYAPQHALLFPHLSVAENVRFAREVCNDPVQKRDIVEDAVALFRVHALAERMPRGLSGGEAQRVSLARAFAVPEARLLLLDEPFSGMDRRLRDELLPAMRAWCAERHLPVLSVTHDVEEAMLLEAEVLRMDAGKIVARGAARDVLAAERERMVQALEGSGKW
jgi:molybdate transport system ATP-binding protein